jgi:hypothetical protein
MAQQRLPIGKIRDVLRLSAACLSKRQIAASLGIGPTAAGACLRRAREAGVGWPVRPPSVPLHHGRSRPNVRPRAERCATTMHRSAEDRGPRGIPGLYAGPAHARVQTVVLDLTHIEGCLIAVWQTLRHRGRLASHPVERKPIDSSALRMAANTWMSRRAFGHAIIAPRRNYSAHLHRPWCARKGRAARAGTVAGRFQWLVSVGYRDVSDLGPGLATAQDGHHAAAHFELFRPSDDDVA